MKDSQNLNPPKFNGVKDPIQAEHWLIQVEKLLDYMECSSEERVTLATFTLTGEAEHWWKTTRTALGAQHQVITWEHFLEAFRQ